MRKIIPPTQFRNQEAKLILTIKVQTANQKEKRNKRTKNQAQRQ
jgi:hypothetical protein